MKYMGSKRFMLRNGLGDLIRDQLPTANRVVDPFCGAGSVVHFVAQSSDKQVIAGDLQRFAVVLARAVIGRTSAVDAQDLVSSWLDLVEVRLRKSPLFTKAAALDRRHAKNVKSWVKNARRLCENKSAIGPVWNAYGGYYFSPKQALTFDYLIDGLPKNAQSRDICLAATIVAAVRCAASPGHTAQPFQPTKTASKFIKVAWDMDIVEACEHALLEIAPLHAQVKGSALVSNAATLVGQLQKGDLVIVDPPYSGVQYSRFYHVLETIARGRCGAVSGVGRYPALSERPQSAFSNVGQSIAALEELLSRLAKKKTTVILTFPKGECSNGLSGDAIIEAAKRWFVIDPASRIHEHNVVVGKFSTLGGNNKQKLKNDRLKTSRVTSVELILLLKPRSNRKPNTRPLLRTL